MFFDFFWSKILPAPVAHFLLLKTESETDPPATKRKRINTAAEWENASTASALIPKRNKSLLEIEEDELASIEGYYGDEIFELATKLTYNLSTMDSLNNIGPCGQVLGFI